MTTGTAAITAKASKSSGNVGSSPMVLPLSAINVTTQGCTDQFRADRKASPEQA
jgi:hypothetical protein